MIYRVKLDGNDILDYQDKRYALLDPALSLKLGEAGSFEFTMPPSHELYGTARLLTSDVEVYEDEELVWFGRPVEIRTDFYRQLSVYCEGALAFLNDSVQPLHEYEAISLHEFFSTVVANHNSQVAAGRQFAVGTVTVPDRTVYRKLNYEPTLDVLKRQCVGSDGGYLLPRRENGANYLDWYADMPGTGNQPAELGLNLLDILGSTDGSRVVTCVLPLGEPVEDGEGNKGAPLTVASANGGNPVIDSEAAATYGRITRAVTFDGVTSAETLYEDGLEYLAASQFADLVVTCKASDIHLQNPNYDAFRLGQVVRCHSTPHLLDRELGITEMSLRLDTEQKELTLGSVRKETLTDIINGTSNGGQSLEDRIDELEDQYEALAEDVDGVEGDIDDIQDAIDDIPDYPLAEELQDQMDDLQDQMDDLQDQMDYMQDQMDDLIGGGGSGGGSDNPPYDPDDPSYDPDDPGGGSDGYDGMSLTEINDAITDLEERLSALENSQHRWTHQVNGSEQESGVVNFVTT